MLRTRGKSAFRIASSSVWTHSSGLAPLWRNSRIAARIRTYAVIRPTINTTGTIGLRCYKANNQPTAWAKGSTRSISFPQLHTFLWLAKYRTWIKVHKKHYRLQKHNLWEFIISEKFAFRIRDHSNNKQTTPHIVRAERHFFCLEGD